jgi:hypothetical protein
VTDNYADYPKSIGELRAERDHLCSSWGPRDCLIEVLRQIDKGEIDPDILIVSYRKRSDDPNKDHAASFRMSASDAMLALGLLTSVLFQLQTTD